MEVDDDDLDVEMIAAVDHGISASYPSTAQVSVRSMYRSLFVQLFLSRTGRDDRFRQASG